MSNPDVSNTINFNLDSLYLSCNQFLDSNAKFIGDTATKPAKGPSRLSVAAQLSNGYQSSGDGSILQQKPTININKLRKMTNNTKPYIINEQSSGFKDNGKWLIDNKLFNLTLPFLILFL